MQKLPLSNAPADLPAHTGPDPSARVLAALRETGRVSTQGLKGAARGYVLARLARAQKPAAPLLCVTADEDSADLLASDVGFFVGGSGTLTAPTVLRVSG